MKSTQKYNKIRFLTVMLILAAVFGWRNYSLAQAFEQDLVVTANFKIDEEISSDTRIELSLNRALKESEKIAFMIEQTDLTALFNQIENHFIYDSTLLPLPPGKSTLTIYLIEPNGSWKELARLPVLVKESIKAEEKKPDVSEVKDKEIKIEASKTGENKSLKNDAGAGNSEADKTDQPKAPESDANAKVAPETEKKRFFKFLPSLTISMESQPFQSNFPIESRPSVRPTFTDFNLTSSLKTEGKIGNLSSESNFDFAGSSFKEKTLQFGTLGKNAPDIDLASYLTNIQLGKAKFSLGHISFGNNRHLVSNFSSRGLSLNIPINKYFDVTGGILNGTSVLGFGNFFGMAKIRHQIQGAALGIEFFPKRQNAVRLEISGFNGYLQALNNVSEGRIVDAERSRGFGVRFLTSSKTERFKLEFGYAMSRFFNPRDTTLDPDGNAVPLTAVIRSAHYSDINYRLLKDVKLTKTKNLNLNFAFKYEYVEPLYRSLGASASADKFTQDYLIDGSIGEITFQTGHARANDNLKNIPSILKLLTRANRFSLALPLAALIGKTSSPSSFLPRLGYSLDRTHNFGASIPFKGGFEIDLATIPDLLNTNQTFSSAWQLKKFTFEYTYNRSYADNRQKGNESKDQLGWVHGVTLGLTPLQILTFNVGLNFDSQRNFELDQVNRTKVLTLGVNWQPFKGATFTGDFSQNLSGDAARTNRSRNINYAAQFAYNFSVEKSRLKKYGMQSFVRFADTFVQNRNFVADLNNRTRTKIMTAGMTFNFF